MNIERANSIVIATLYKFFPLTSYHKLRDPLLKIMLKNEIKGTILLAKEGINGTVSGYRMGIDRLISWLKSEVDLADFSYQESFHNKLPFSKARVKIKKEIVTLGRVPDVLESKSKGSFINPRNWNDLISDPEVLVIDVRNYYETAIGTFENSLDPSIESFRKFPDYITEHSNIERNRKIAIFCTGGIRCEKASTFMKNQGFKEIYQLKGGILGYLKEVPKDSSKWRGECFVFDERTALNHELIQGQYSQCYACRMPLQDLDRKSRFYRPGISCSYCYGKLSNKLEKTVLERQKQRELSKVNKNRASL